MDCVVWVDEWQQQCCGDPFGIGTAVRWPVARLDDSDERMEHLFGPDAPPVGFHQQTHGDVGEELETVVGAVSAIDAVICEFAPAEPPPEWPEANVFAPVGGSGTIRPVTDSELRLPGVGGGSLSASFEGWIVRLRDAHLEPIVN